MGSRKKEEQLRVRTLLSDTVTLLCKNGLSFKKNLKVQGLLGITVDDDEVFIVHLNETMGDLVSASDPDQTEARTPSKNSESGRRSPKRKRRRRSTDSNKSKEQEEECIDLDPDIEIKTEPDMLVVDELKYEGTPSKQSCRYPDEGLNFAIGSISSQNERFAPGSRGITPQGRQAADSLNTTSDSDANLSSASPFITGIIPNVADTSNQSSESGSFQWDNSAGQQGFPGISNWGSQIAQQAMSQSDMSQQPGTSQGGPMGYSPSIRTGTGGVFGAKAEANLKCASCQQVARKSKISGTIRKLKMKGVLQAQLPRFTEQPIPSNRNCALCVQRLQYFRRGNARKRDMGVPRKPRRYGPRAPQASQIPSDEGQLEQN